MTEDSNKSLKEKLGLKEGMSTHFSHAPTEYFDEIGGNVFSHRPDDDGVFDFIHAFFTEKDQLIASSQILVSKLADNGMLWISWPKKSSGVKTDISDQDLRDILLPLGVVDVKVCAVTDIWSGLKFVWRKTSPGLSQ